jgi:hypothetical protein
MNNAIIAATRRARVFERAEPINPFDSPPAQRSALHEYYRRQPPRPPGTVIAAHPATDSTAILAPRPG